MIVNKQILTQAEITKIIKRLESLIMTEFFTTPSEAKNLIIQNKRLIHVDPSQLTDSVFLFKTKFFVLVNFISAINFNGDFLKLFKPTML